ncbi:hypothetical protein [uncultured Deinococcus sp.]|uniref:hypothetical protein n=1 Tax=uncultured Deinococcus sp. TaxID=158789 RepID=UPI0025DBCCF0|nr:hypothetical protein [uncultured Deinococcus sp.]
MGLKRITPGLVLDSRYPLLYEMEGLAGTLSFPGAQAFAARYALTYYNGSAYHVGSDNRVQAINITTNAQSILAGQTTAGETDGTGAAAQFNAPFDLVSDGGGTLYVADRVGGTIRKVIVATGVVTTLATGLGTLLGICLSIDKTALYFTSSTAANGVRKLLLSNNTVTVVCAAPAGTNFYGLAHTRMGLLIVSSDYFNAGITNGVYVCDPTATTPAATLLAGSTKGSVDGIGAAAQFNTPLRISMGRNDVYAYLPEVNGNRIRRLNIDTRAVTTLVGDGTAADTAGTGTGAQIRQPGGVVFRPDSAELYAISASPGTAGKFSRVV